jgi:hypothetical protein
VVTVTIDARTGKLPYADDTGTMDEVFLAGTEPTKVAPPPDLVDGGESP